MSTELSAYVSLRAAAEAKGLPVRTLSRWCQEEKVPALRVGSIYLIDRRWVQPDVIVPELSERQYGAVEVARWLGINRTMVTLLARVGKLDSEAVRVSGHVVARLITRRALLKFLADNTIGPDVEDTPPNPEAAP